MSLEFYNSTLGHSFIVLIFDTNFSERRSFGLSASGAQILIDERRARAHLKSVSASANSRSFFALNTESYLEEMSL